MRGGAVWKLAWLITKRSLVRILLPLLGQVLRMTIACEVAVSHEGERKSTRAGDSLPCKSALSLEACSADSQEDARYRARCESAWRERAEIAHNVMNLPVSRVRGECGDWAGSPPYT